MKLWHGKWTGVSDGRGLRMFAGAGGCQVWTSSYQTLNHQTNENANSGDLVMEMSGKHGQRADHEEQQNQESGQSSGLWGTAESVAVFLSKAGSGIDWRRQRSRTRRTASAGQPTSRYRHRLSRSDASCKRDHRAIEHSEVPHCAGRSDTWDRTATCSAQWGRCPSARRRRNRYRAVSGRSTGSRPS